MRLNHDCIRYVLLTCERHLTLNNTVEFPDLQTDKFSNDDIVYSVIKLKEAQYLKAEIYLDHNSIDIVSITWEGHKFLDTIRDDKVWSQTKTILGKVSSASITFASNVASQVLTNIISKQMGLM